MAKSGKKLVSILMAFALLFNLSVTTFAKGETATDPVGTFDELKTALESAQGTAEEPAEIYISGMLEAAETLTIKDGQYIKLIGTDSSSGLKRVESYTGNIIAVGDNSTALCALTLSSLIVDGGAVWSDGAGSTNSGLSVSSSMINVSKSAVMYLEDGTVLRNNDRKSGDGSAVTVSGTLYINGGEISANAITGRGGGVYVKGADSGKAVMNGGTITKNHATNQGGALYENNGGTFTLNSGTITQNSADSESGGVRMNNGTFTMNGGEVSKNTSPYKGGGVYINNGGKFIMTDGKITQNTCTDDGKTAYGGGGLYMNNASGSCTITGGEISNNEAAGYGGGIYAYQGALKLGGSVKISGNQQGTETGNVALGNTSSAKLYLIEQFENGAGAGGVTPVAMTKDQVVATVEESYGTFTEEDIARYLPLERMTSAFGLTLEGSSIVLKDITTGCDHTNGFEKGNGSAVSPYVITTAEQLLHVEEHNGAYFVANNDLDVSGVSGLPMYKTTAFTGNFDGGNHTIEGISSLRDLFYSVSADASVSGVKYVVNATATATTLEKAEIVDDKTVRVTFSAPVESVNASEIIASASLDNNVLYSTPGKFVDVTEYGALPDDQGDDIYALQAAVDAAKDGGVVYFPKGVYLVSKALVFYSNQTLFFEDGATLKRGSGTLTYLLANHTDGTETGYSATKNVNIIGCTFDGNDKISYKITMMNTGHCENLNLLNCTFRNGDQWHYFECNSSKNILIDGCTFEDSYGIVNDSSEYLQFDRAQSGVYGIIESVFGKEQFKFDGTGCTDVVVRNCVFDCTKSKCVAVGNHTDGPHTNIQFYDNIFKGGNASRGIINLMPSTSKLTFANNTFSNCAYGIWLKHTEKDSVSYSSNTFMNVTTPLTGGIETVEGEGLTTPAFTHQTASSVQAEGSSNKTYLVTFAESVQNAACVIALNSVTDEDDRQLTPNFYANTQTIGSAVSVGLPKADLFDLAFGNSITSTSNAYGTPAITTSGNGTVGKVTVPHNGKYYETTGYTKSAQSDYVTIDLTANGTDVHNALADGFTIEVAFTLPESDGHEVGILNGAGSGKGMGITYEKVSGKLDFCFHDGAYKYAYSGTNLKVGELYYLTGVYDNSAKTITLYINGEKIGEAAVGNYNANTAACRWTMGKSPTGDSTCKENIFTMARLYSDVMTAAQAKQSYDKYIASLTLVKEAKADIFDLQFKTDGTITSAVGNYGSPVVSGNGGTVGTVIVPHNGKIYETTGFERESSTDLRVINMEAKKTEIINALSDGYTLELAFTLPKSSGSETGIFNGAVKAGGMGITYEKYNAKNVAFCHHDGAYNYAESGALTEGELYVITCVYDAADKEIETYVNGKLAKTTTGIDKFNVGGFFATWFMGASPNTSGNSTDAKANSNANTFTMARLYSDPMAGPQVKESYEAYIKTLKEVVPDSELKDVSCIEPLTGIVELTFTYPVHIMNAASVTLNGAAAQSIEYVSAATGSDELEYSTTLKVKFETVAQNGALVIADADGSAVDGKLDSSVIKGLYDNAAAANGISGGVDAITGTVTFVTPSTATLEKAEVVNSNTVRLTFSDPVEILDAVGIVVSNDLDESVLYETPGAVVNVLDYGAIPDDDGDDIYALQDAVDAAKSGGVVYFPKGVYLVTKALVFYSNQTLYFEDGAVLKRNATNLTYLLANHTDGTETGYTATENVNIIGCTFDGNENINYKITMMNTGHCRNINLLNCTFRNGYTWHYFECNSTDTILIDGCVFEDSYNWNNNSGAEYLQFDAADSGAYGIIQSVFGSEAFKFDGTACKNVTVRNCVFDSTNSRCVAIGNHNNKAHNTMSFYDNEFKGGMDYNNRGTINFTSNVYGLTFANNKFSDSPVGITVTNSDYTIYESNTFTNVTTNWTGILTAAAGNGLTTPKTNAWYSAASQATLVDPVQIGGNEYSTTVLVSFDSLTGADEVLVRVGSAKDSDGALLKANAFAGDRYVGASAELERTASSSGSSDSAGKTKYAITVADINNGSVSVDRKSASDGATVTVSITPNTGYTLETLTVTDSTSNAVKLTRNSDGIYSFKMPAGKVTVAATFMDDNTMLNFFVDVPADSYFYDAVLWAVQNGITTGVDDMHFVPYNTCTRAQIVTFLWRAAGCPEPISASGFSDVPANAYYCKAVAWAVENGITTGVTADTFCPDQTCTRAQAVAFLFRYAAAQGIDAVTLQELVSGYTDAASVPGYALSAFNWALSSSIVQGNGGALMPNSTCTRAQIVTFLYRLLGK